MLAGWYQQAKVALKNGNKAKAQGLLIQVITEKPTYEEASRYLHLAVTGNDSIELKNKTVQLQKETAQLQSEKGQLQSEKEQLTGNIERLNKLLITILIGGALLIIVLFFVVFSWHNSQTKTLSELIQEVQQEKQQLETETTTLKAELQSTSDKLKVFDVIKNYNRFVVAVRQDFKPFSYLNEKEEMAGFEVDIVREFARRWFKDEKALILRPMKADSALSSLKNHQTNLVTGVSIEESEQLDSSVSYFQDNKRLLVRRDSGIRGLCDIRGKRIAIVKGSLAKKRLQFAVEDHQCGFEIHDRKFEEFES